MIKGHGGLFLARDQRIHLYAFAPALLVGLLCSGCRAMPISLGTMVVGDAVSSAEIKDRQADLLGKSPRAAEAMFGKRLETLVDTANSRRQLLVYKDQGDVLGNSRYVVEVLNGRIVALSKNKKNIDGVENVVEAANLRDKMLGKSPVECQRIGKLGRPLVVLRSQDTGQQVGVYDVKNFTNLRGARYCVLRFDSQLRCASINLVGVSASTNTGGMVQGSGGSTRHRPSGWPALSRKMC